MLLLLENQGNQSDFEVFPPSLLYFDDSQLLLTNYVQFFNDYNELIGVVVLKEICSCLPRYR
jgi:hypothetical protein